MVGRSVCAKRELPTCICFTRFYICTLASILLLCPPPPPPLLLWLPTRWLSKCYICIIIFLIGGREWEYSPLLWAWESSSHYFPEMLGDESLQSKQIASSPPLSLSLPLSLFLSLSILLNSIIVRVNKHTFAHLSLFLSEFAGWLEKDQVVPRRLDLLLGFFNAGRSRSRFSPVSIKIGNHHCAEYANVNMLNLSVFSEVKQDIIVSWVTCGGKMEGGGKRFVPEQLQQLHFTKTLLLWVSETT